MRFTRPVVYYTDRSMGQDSGGPPPANATAKRSALSADEVRAFIDRAPRCRVSLQVLCTIPGEGQASEILEAELVNVSSSGMLLEGPQLLPNGAVVDFQYKLDDGLVALSGRAEVVRTVTDPPRMGLRFVVLEPAALSLVQSLVDSAPPEIPPPPPAPVEFEEDAVRVRLTARTASFFT